MKTVWYKIKSSVWWLVSLVVLSIGMLWFLYNLVRPTENKAEFMENAQTKVHTAIKENEIRAKLEKDKIGAIKKIYDQKLKETKEVMEFYDEWGLNNKYDKDMVDWNYTGPKETSEVDELKAQISSFKDQIKSLSESKKVQKILKKQHILLKIQEHYQLVMLKNK